MTDSSGTITVTTAAAHNLSSGNIVTFSGASPTAFNGTYYVTSVPTSTTFTYVPATDPGGSATTVGAYTAMTPGTFPTNWGGAARFGVTETIVNAGIANGMNFIDVNFSGTPTATSFSNLTLDNSSDIGVANGQIWSNSLYFAIIAGSASGFSGISMQSAIYSSMPSVTYLNELGNSGVSLASATSTLSRYSYAGSISAATASTMAPYLQFRYTSGIPVNLTVRIAAPQLEHSSSVTSFIPTYGTAVSRSADLFSTPFDGTYIDASGNMQMATTSVARDDHLFSSPYTDLGTLIEPAATNSIRNNTGVGVVPGAVIAAQTISSITDASGTATVTTALAHGLTVGNIVTVSGATPPNFNGTFIVASVPSSTTYTYAMLTDPGGNATAVGTYLAQTTGTFPTNWGVAGLNGGLTAAVIGSGSANNIDYVDILFAGINNSGSTQYPVVKFDTSTGIAASQGQNWSNSVYMATTAGSAPSMFTGWYENNSSGNALKSDQTGSGATLTSTLVRSNLTQTLSLSATSYVQPWVFFGVANGASVNFILRVGMPQMEKGTAKSSVIPTATAAVIRNADVYSTGFDGTYFDGTGTLQTATTSVARDNHNAASPYGDLGTIIEPTATNGIRNSTMQGAVASTYITAQTISGITDSSGTATVTAAANHNLAVGNVVTVSGASPSNYNGTFAVVSVPSSTTFTYVMATDPAANATTVGSYTAQTAGTVPTNWATYSTNSGITPIIVGTGNESGINYMDVQFVGTAIGSTANLRVYVDTTTGIAASQGQQWTSSMFLKLSGGSVTNIRDFNLVSDENSVGAYLGGGITTVPALTSAALASNRVSFTHTVASGGTAGVRPYFLMDVNAGLAVNVTVRVGLPQMEQGSVPTTPIPTYNAALSRSADVFSNPFSGTYVDNTGTLQTSTTSVARDTHSMTSPYADLGTVVEPGATNGVRNSQMIGAIATATITAQTISSITDSSGTATVTTAAAHILAVGNTITVSGASPANYNGTFAVTSVPSTTTFTYAMATDPAANASSVGSYTAKTVGTLPTYWSAGANSGLIRTIVGSGVQNGIPYVDVNVSGTTTGTSLALNLDVEGGSIIAATTGQVWTTSYYLALVSGTIPNYIHLALAENSSGGGNVKYDVSGVALVPTSTLAQYSYTATLNGGSTAWIEPELWIYDSDSGQAHTSNQVVNFTLRVGLPQMEQNAFVTTPIPTSNAAVSRAADVYTTPFDGTYIDNTGTMQTATISVARDDHNPVNPYPDLGTLIEPAATNGVRNNAMVGAIASVSLTAQTISSITDSSGTATVTTAAVHGLAVGELVQVTGASPSTYNGNYKIASVPTTTTFTYTMASDPGANATAVGSYTARTNGTMPTNWTNFNGFGISQTVIGSGVQNGIPYMDVRFAGVSTGASGGSVGFDGTQGIAAASGQTWTQSVYMAMVAGSTANLTVIRMDTDEYNSGGTSTKINYNVGGSSLLSLTSSLTRYSGQTTLSGTGTAYVQPIFEFGFNSGVAIDITIRFGLPQIEQSSWLTSAIPTMGSTVTRNADVYMNPSGGSYFDVNGVLQTAAPNAPRRDYDPVTHVPKGILIEETRTNLVATSSGTSGEGPGAGQATTYTQSTTLSPDGVTYMNKCIDSPASSGAIGQVCRWGSMPISQSTAYTASAFLKTGERSYLTYLVSDGVTTGSVTVNLAAGTSTLCGTGLAPLTAVQNIGNGVYRVSITVTTSSSAVSPGYFDFRMSNVSNPACTGDTYTGDGASGLYIWGVQFEKGGTPTSYIATSGSTLARSTDKFTIPLTGWYSSSAGTLGTIGTSQYADTSNLTNHFFAAIDDSTASNDISAFISRGATPYRKTQIFNSGSGVLTSVSGYTYGAPTWIALTYNGSNFNSGIDGTSYSGTALTIPTLTQLSIGSIAGSNVLDGWDTRVWYMPTLQPTASMGDYTR